MGVSVGTTDSADMQLRLKFRMQLKAQGPSLVAQTGKNLPTMLETWVQSLGWEDSLERGRKSTPVFLPGEFHGWRSLGVLEVTKSQTRPSN